ncbi:MAG: galactitol-1-phosphate 5-dehydrogenase [Anaerolineaceae bacterium]|nr:galactitol-1-phosphate 5-dehydrogenase [Anaerolineaceae bacterium]
MAIPDTMNAVVLEAPQQIVYKQIPVPELEAGWVLLKVGAVSICGSDVLRVWHGHARVLPIVLGHECAGTVVKVGDSVDEDLMDRRFALIPLIPNMESPISKMGFYSSSPGYSFIGSRINGGFAEYVAVPATNIIELPDDVPVDIGALIEPSTVAYHALNRGGGVKGKSVAVFGVGSIGLLTIQMAKALGADQVIAVDIADHQLEAARQFGAHETVNARDSVASESIMAMTTYGVDLSVEVAGVPATLMQAIFSTRAGGDVVLVGNQPVEKEIKLDFFEQFMRRQLNMHGSWMSYSAPFPGIEWQGTLDMMQDGRLKLEDMITHRIALNELPNMFQQIHQGGIAYRKIMVTF